MKPDAGITRDTESKDAPESSKRKREASKESHKAEGTESDADPRSDTIADVTPSYYNPPLNMAGLNDVGMEVDSSVSQTPALLERHFH
jgi:hypothetical protein